MRKKSRSFAALDIVYIAMMILPIVAALALKVITTPPSDGVSITGAQIYFTIPMPIQNLPINKSQVSITALRPKWPGPSQLFVHICDH